MEWKRKVPMSCSINTEGFKVPVAGAAHKSFPEFCLHMWIEYIHWKVLGFHHKNYYGQLLLPARASGQELEGNHKLKNKESWKNSFWRLHRDKKEPKLLPVSKGIPDFPQSCDLTLSSRHWGAKMCPELGMEGPSLEKKGIRGELLVLHNSGTAQGGIWGLIPGNRRRGNGPKRPRGGSGRTPAGISAQGLLREVWNLHLQLWRSVPAWNLCSWKFWNWGIAWFPFCKKEKRAWTKPSYKLVPQFCFQVSVSPLNLILQVLLC